MKKIYDLCDREIQLKDHYFKCGEPDRFDLLVEKIVPFMVSDPSCYVEKFKETFADDEDTMLEYNLLKKEADKNERDYFKFRLVEKYEQYLYCFFPEKYEELEKRREDKARKNLLDRNI